MARYHHNLSIDEPFVALAIAQPSALLATLAHDNAPLFYALLTAWTRLFGASEFALRALSLAAFGGAILFTAETTPRRGAAALAAILVACSVPFGLEPAATARPYALLTLFSAMALWAAAGERAFALIAAHVLGLFTHPIFLFVSVASAISGGVFGRRRVLLVAAPLGAIASYLAVWGWMLRRTFALPATSWMSAPTAPDIVRGLELWGDHATLIVAALLLVLVAVRGFGRGGRTASSAWFAMGVAVLAFGGAVAASQFRPVFFAARTPVIVLPAAAVAVAAIVTELGSAFVAAAVALLVVTSAVRHTALSVRHGDPFPTRASLAAIASRARCGDRILAVGLSYAPLLYYARAAQVPDCVAIEPFPADVREHPGWLAPPPGSGPDLDSRLPGTLWVFVAHQGPGAAEARAVHSQLSSRRRLRESLPLRGSFFDEVDVYPPPDQPVADP